MTCPKALEYLAQIAQSVAPKQQAKQKGSLASQYLEYDRGGFQTRRVVSVVALSTTPKQILNESTDRWSWKIINPDASIAETAWFDSTVATNYGIILTPRGGNAGASLKNDGMLTENAVWAVADSGTPNVFVVEEVLI